MRLTPFHDVQISAWFVLILLFAYLLTTYINIRQDATIQYQKQVIRQLGDYHEAQK